MKVKALREYMNGLSENLDDFDIVFAKVDTWSNGKWTRQDSLIDNFLIDQDTETFVAGSELTIENMVNIIKSKEQVDVKES